MSRSFRTIDSAIRRIALDGLRTGLQLAAVRDLIRQYLRRNNVAEALAEEIIGEATRQFVWMQERTATPAQRDAITSLLADVAPGFAKIEGAIVDAVLKAVERGLREDRSRVEIEKAVADSTKQAKRYAATITTTAISAFGRAGKIIQAQQAGATLMKYVGPPADRQFCQLLLSQAAGGKLWTIDEINDLTNGQGLSVLYYCGGYNCRHHWLPVVG